MHNISFMLLSVVSIKLIKFGWKLKLVYNSTLLWTENKLPELLTIDASHQISNLSSSCFPDCHSNEQIDPLLPVQYEYNGVSGPLGCAGCSGEKWGWRGHGGPWHILDCGVSSRQTPLHVLYYSQAWSRNLGSSSASLCQNYRDR